MTRVFNRTASTLLLLGALLTAGCRDQSLKAPDNTPGSAKSHSEPHLKPIENDHSLRDEKANHPESQTSVKSSIRFEPLSEELFPNAVPQNGSRHGYATILESLGSGGAAIDLDQDGLIDAIIAGGGDLEDKKTSGLPIFCLRNRRDKFSDSSDVAGCGVTSWYNHGVSAADFDQDGFQDLLITGYGGVQLFHNLGDGTFEDTTMASAIDCPTWSCSAAWADFNHDGALDLYITGYVNWSFENDPPCFAADGVRRDNCSPKLFDAVPDYLFLSAGDGSFTDATQQFGVRSDGKALGVVAADLDFDGFIDLYVGNDVMMNYLYQNDHGQQFRDLSISSGAGVSSRGSPDASMGVEVADYNLDGRPDIWAANFEMESFALYQNQGNWLFRHMSDATGVSAIGEQYVGWGSTFADFDLDGDEDICVCNGNVVKFPQHSPAMQRMLVLENVDGSWFAEVTDQTGAALMKPQNGRGLAMMDWDRDGRLDLLSTPTESPAMLLHNTAKVSGHWLNISLVGTHSPRQPIGARLELRTSSGRRIRQLKGGGSYASTSCPEIHFGIPAGTSVEELIVHWPSGAVQNVPSPTLDSHLCLIESSDAPSGASQSDGSSRIVLISH